MSGYCSLECSPTQRCPDGYACMSGWCQQICDSHSTDQYECPQRDDDVFFKCIAATSVNHHVGLCSWAGEVGRQPDIGG